MAQKNTENSPSDLWTRRSNSNKLSLSTNKSSPHHNNADRDDAHTTSAKRFGSISSKTPNPFNAPPGTLASPTTTGSGASSAFGLGSGAFGFGTGGGGGKTPRTPGSAFDFGGGKSTVGAEKKADSASEKEGSEKDTAQRRPQARKSLSSVRISTEAQTPTSASAAVGAGRDATVPWPLKYTWVLHYRPPQTSKTADYEKSIQPLCRIGTAQDFWKSYAHLKRPSDLPAVSDYHIFKDGIRPVWEDEANKSGGKWIMRLKKGVVDRYWEELLLALVGDQFLEASEEICGAVVSVRQGEDVFSIWTRHDGGKNVKIRETLKRLLSLPADTVLLWRSHDEGKEADAARQAKSQQLQSDKRRSTVTAKEGQRSGGGIEEEKSKP